MLLATVGAFVAIGLFAVMPHWTLAMVCLALFGWLSAISSLLQYTLIQTQTPEAMLGRINGLWTAQNVTGDAIGAALLGGLGAILTPVASASVSGWGLAIVGGILLLVLGELRRFRREIPASTEA
jgi:ENTS family enterobactin (siderophore) exporter